MQFSEREKAFEDRFAHDEEIQFKVRARRNKQVGMWAAEKLGKQGDAAHDYADQLVIEMLDKESLLRRLHEDFARSGINVSETQLFRQVDELAIAARNFFMEGK